MCKSTKGNQPANPPGEDPNPAPPAPARFDGVPEHVPDLTFIVERRIATDDFINGANTYHTNCGMQQRSIQSLGQMVDLLSAAAGRVGRIRLVTHASGDDLIVPLFGQSSVQADRHTLKDHLRAFAESDERGLLKILMLNLGGHFFGWNRATVMTMIRTDGAGLLTPFGIEQSGLPPDNLERFIFYCLDHAMVTRNWIKKNNANLNANEKSHLLRAVDALIVMKTPASPGAAALRTFLTGRTMAQLGLTNADFFGYTGMDASTLNIFLLAGRAADAITAGFRAKLTTVRGRLDENSIIDIRGCRAGSDRDYLRAFQEFFGRTGHRPTVTGPRWYQYFGPCADRTLTGNAQIHTLLTSGAAAAANRTAFEQWAERSQINARHKTYWLTQLNGDAARFSHMQWRTTFPQIPLQAPGLTAFAAMNFNLAIARIGVLFNVAAASVPSGAALDTVNTFVTTKLNGFAANLFAVATDANKAALHTALHAINQDLGLALVPAAAPNPLNTSHITGYQTALIGHLDANQLLPIKNFMTACKNRIEAAGDPGIYYYMLNAGMPVFLFSNVETVSGHVVTVTHNRLVVHHDFADAAYRQWPLMLWAEPLPASNLIGTLHMGNNDALRFAMMVELPDGGNTTVAACPHPDYMDKIVTVTNTPDF